MMSVVLSRNSNMVLQTPEETRCLWILFMRNFWPLIICFNTPQNFDSYELRLSHRQAARMLTIETAPKMESLQFLQRVIESFLVNCVNGVSESVCQIPGYFKRSCLWIQERELLQIAGDPFYEPLSRLSYRVCEWRVLFNSTDWTKAAFFPHDGFTMLHSVTGVCSNMELSSVLIAVYITTLLYCGVVAGGTPFSNDCITRTMFHSHNILNILELIHSTCWITIVPSSCLVTHYSKCMVVTNKVMLKVISMHKTRYHHVLNSDFNSNCDTLHSERFAVKSQNISPRMVLSKL